MRLTLAVVDDQDSDLERLRQDITLALSRQSGYEVDIDSFPDAQSFLCRFAPGAYSIVFLDIVMEGMNGIELARKIRAADPELLIIFITTSQEYAFEAFPLHTFDYLIKPCEPAAIERVVTEALRAVRVNDRVITVRVNRAMTDIPLHSLIAVLSQGHTTELRIARHGPLFSTMTFTELEALLASDPRFLLCNRGILINMDYVLTLQDGDLIMTDSSIYPLRTRDRASLKKQISQYMILKMRRGVGER